MFSSGSINLTIKSDSLIYKIGSSGKVNIDIDNSSDLNIKKSNCLYIGNFLYIVDRDWFIQRNIR